MYNYDDLITHDLLMDVTNTDRLLLARKGCVTYMYLTTACVKLFSLHIVYSCRLEMPDRPIHSDLVLHLFVACPSSAGIKVSFK